MTFVVGLMRQGSPRFVQFASALARGEIILLTIVYGYFVVSDAMPPLVWVLIALIWIARWWTRGTLTLLTPLDLPILLILILLPLSLSVSTNWWLSLPKVYGVVLGVVFFYAVVNGVATPTDLAWATFWVVLICAGMALAGLVGTDWAQGKIVSASFIYDHLPRFVQGIPRSIAGGFARNGVGGTMSLIVPFLASLWFGHYTIPGNVMPERFFKSAVAMAFLLALTALALTQSRGAILGTVVGLGAVALWRERRVKWIIVALAAGLLLLIVVGQGGALTDFLLRMDTRSGTLASRLEVWQRGILMVQDFPYTGIGIGTYNVVAHLLYPFFIAAPDEVVAHAHNNLLEVAVDLGIPGLIAFTALLAGFVLCLVHAYRSIADEATRALVAGLGFGMLAHQVFGLTDAFILGTKPGVLMWIFFGLAAAAYRESRNCHPTGILGKVAREDQE